MVNHCGTTPTVAVKQKPRPMPKQTPWLRSSCHICKENEAPIKEALVIWVSGFFSPKEAAAHASSTTPIQSVHFVPHLPIHTVTSGETRRATTVTVRELEGCQTG